MQFARHNIFLWRNVYLHAFFWGRELYHLRMEWILFQCGNLVVHFISILTMCFLEFIHNRVNNLHTFLQILWFSVVLGTSVSCTYKADPHDMTSLLLKVALITIPPPFKIALIKKKNTTCIFSQISYYLWCDLRTILSHIVCFPLFHIQNKLLVLLHILYFVLIYVETEYLTEEGVWTHYIDSYYISW